MNKAVSAGKYLVLWNLSFSLAIYFLCSRLRLSEPETSKFEIRPETLQTYKQYILLDLQHSETKHLYVLKLAAVKGGIFHFQIDEKSPLSERYRVVDALAKEPEYVGVKVESSSASTIVVSTEAGTNKAVIQVAPFKIDFYHGEKVVVSANSMGLMRFEHLRRKEVAPPAPVENEQEEHENEVQEVVCLYHLSFILTLSCSYFTYLIFMIHVNSLYSTLAEGRSRCMGRKLQKPS